MARVQASDGGVGRFEGASPIGEELRGTSQHDYEAGPNATNLFHQLLLSRNSNRDSPGASALTDDLVLTRTKNSPSVLKREFDVAVAESLAGAAFEKDVNAVGGNGEPFGEHVGGDVLKWWRNDLIYAGNLCAGPYDGRARRPGGVLLRVVKTCSISTLFRAQSLVISCLVVWQIATLSSLHTSGILRTLIAVFMFAY